MEQAFTAVCRRSGRWWAVSIRELKGVHIQARRLDQVEDMDRDAIGLMLDIDPAEITVQVEPCPRSSTRCGRPSDCGCHHRCPPGRAAGVAPATLPDGTAVIVKISWPHREMYGEAAALRLWDGRGADGSPPGRSPGRWRTPCGGQPTATPPSWPTPGCSRVYSRSWYAECGQRPLNRCARPAPR